MQKRAESPSLIGGILWAIPVIIFVSILVIVFGTLLTKDINLKVSTDPNFEVDLYLHRVLSNPSCLVVMDKELERPLIGILDRKKLTNVQMKHCFDTDDYVQLSVMGETGLIAAMQIDFKGTSKLYKRQKPIYVLDNGKLIPATLELEVMFS